MHCGSVYVGRLHCLCRRLCVGKEGRVSVVDIGTGPFALLAIAAAKAGARKVRVYAIEADPEVAKLARRAIEESGVTKGTIVVRVTASRLEPS
eukprot:505850-Prorocentrum_minimum.AAC.2